MFYLSIYLGKRASCLVNPRACYETTLKITQIDPKNKQNLAVIGAGPAGLAFATTAAQRGHKVTLFEKDGEIGGQFNMAKLIPGKEEFYETLRYFKKQIELNGIDLKLNTVANASDLDEFDRYLLIYESNDLSMYLMIYLFIYISMYVMI
jgi:2,4-dienoyl-CoA reductase (NADPH2)